jgi:hypothetical protein
MSATVTFNTCGPCFVGTINYNNLPVDTSPATYSLVYYKDVDPRWEGEGKVTIIGTFTPDSDGTGSVSFNNCDLSTIPAKDDYNAGPDINYGVEGASKSTGDNYEHINGAKLWLVPTALIDTKTNEIIWGTELEMQAAILWETDLALYIDCNEIPPIWLPYVYPLFDTTTLQPNQVYCWLSCYHTVINIMPGAYAFDTQLIPIV